MSSTNIYNRRFGWIRDYPDPRDYRYQAPKAILEALPPRVDLRETYFMPPIFDQGNLGSCTANAVASTFEFTRVRQKLADWTPSRLHNYWYARFLEGTTHYDAGAYLRDSVKVLNKWGIPQEEIWPYIIEKFTQKPPCSVKRAAEKNKAITYYRINQALNDMKACLADGYPFVFGFNVYPSFMTEIVARTGIVPMPAPGEQAIGGHAVVAIGYNDVTQRFLVRNSWSEYWGVKGYFTMPYAYVADNSEADDFWTIRLVK